MNELTTMMLGASGTGKTTLLTSIYDEFEKISEEVNFQLRPDPETKALLQEYLEKLKSMGDEMKAEERRKGIQGTAATAGPESLPKFTFDLGREKQRSDLRLIFCDYPGGYLASNNDRERNYVINLLKESSVVIVTIDTPAMIEPRKIDYSDPKNWDIYSKSGQWNEARNQPEEILDLFKSAYSRLKKDDPKLVILAPVKCETYVQTEDSALKLLEVIKNQYATLLNFLADQSRRDNIAIVTTPVQTVGCQIFWKLELEDFNKPQFWFRKKSPNAPYQPQDNDHLLRYLLSFLLKLHNQGLLISRSPLLRGGRQLMNLETPFEQAVRTFAKTRKKTEGFTVLQGNQWLNL